MKLKILTKKDIDLIIELEKHSAPEKPHYARYDIKALSYIFENPNKCGAFGMFDDKKLIGWGAYRSNWKKNNKESEICEVSSIVVDKDYRRSGLGNTILNKILEVLKLKKLDKAFLTVSPLNVGALILYLKRGFLIYDFRKDIYGPGADRIYLEINL